MGCLIIYKSMKKKLKQGPVKFAEKEQINGHITLIVGLYNILD